MMQKLRLKFIRIAMLALTLAMLLVTVAINLMNWLNVRAEISETMTFLAEVGGSLSNERAREWAGRSRHRENVLTQAVYFIGSSAPGSTFQIVYPERTGSVSRESALDLLSRAASSGRETGFLDDYCFRRYATRNGAGTWLFLNCDSYLSASRNLLTFSLIICAAGILLSLLTVSLLSRRAIRPFILNERKQKRFITDASHELKAPLAVISANMDVLAMDDPDNQWINSTRSQTASMRRLVEDMVYLSRADETEHPEKTEPVDLQRLIRETAQPYQAIAEFQNKVFRCEASEGLSVRGEEAALQRVVSILCDNAVKYTPEGGTITLRGRSEGKYAVIETENPPVRPLSDEDCTRLFDRFYRADESRDRKQTGGYGIGLSIAKAVVTRHGGAAEAHMTPGGTLLIRLTLRMKTQAN